MKRLNTATFIERANQVHAGKYDYSKTVYKNMHDKVIITCPEHGDFEQAPTNHLAGKGCPDCNPSKRNTQASFVKKARAVHGDKYDYSKVVFTRNKDKVIIICPKHGEFFQEANSHLQGFGCPECNNEQRSARYKPETMEKSHATIKARYGVDNAMELDSVKQKVADTVQQKYGVDNALKLPETKAKAKAAIVKKYGVESAFAAKTVREKAAQTMLARYGVKTPMENPDVKNAARATMQARYGVSEAMMDPDIVEKMKQSTIKNDTKRKHGTFSTSVPEDKLNDLLIARFGQADVVRQYRDDVRYPFNCDFYIRSRDLFIELNAHWTHGTHWFSDADQKTIDNWTKRQSKYYDLAIDTFSSRDVNKRKTAAKHQLNYLVFWDPKLRDASMWLDSGAPDSHDYVREYAWLPDRLLTNTERTFKNLTPRAMSQLVKQYQFDVFYQHELDLWKQNQYTHKGFPLRAELFMNRYQYLGLTPAQITDRKLLTGFAVSGLWRGFSEFDTTLMVQVIDQYKPEFIYDPFAGWGERGFMAAEMRVEYFGVDINQALSAGYRKMIVENNLHGINYKIADAQNVKLPAGADMVVTCPPYFDIEKYTDVGIENKSYAEFLAAFAKIVANCAGVKYFCFQINQKYKADLCRIVQNSGYHLINSYQYTTNRGSHLQRNAVGASTKREFEQMFVFETN